MNFSFIFFWGEAEGPKGSGLGIPHFNFNLATLRRPATPLSLLLVAEVNLAQSEGRSMDRSKRRGIAARSAKFEIAQKK